jgi:hypothetical protein
VTRAVALTLSVAAALLVGAVPGEAADECKGLQSCIPVTGPWVAIPAPGGLATTASWQLVCPNGIVGGVDARASEKAVAVEFPGRLGSPVNPGITTSKTLLFRGTYAGGAPRATSYQPFIGCIPTQGGGQRTRVSFQPTAGVKPGQSITIRANTLAVKPGTLARGTYSCFPSERMLGSTDSVGLYTGTAVPTKAQLAAIHVIRVRRGTRVLVSATRHGLPAALRAEVQVQVMCAS